MAGVQCRYCLPEGAIFTFIQTGEAAVQASDLTMGDCGEHATNLLPDDQELTSKSCKITFCLNARTRYLTTSRR